MSNRDFEIHPQLTALAIAYKQEGMIAEMVSPYFTVDTESFKWLQVDPQNTYNVEDDAIGETGQANEIKFYGKLQTSSTVDRALDVVMGRKREGTDVPYNSMQTRTMLTMEKVLLNREIRVASLVTTLANYTYGTTLSGTSQFSDYTNSDPVRLIKNAMDQPLERPNVIGMAREVATVLSVHPKILTAVSRDSRLADGSASLQSMADLFEVDKIFVGGARRNTANRGQMASIGRVWGKDLWLIKVDDAPDPINGSAGFTSTARFGNRVTRVIDEPKYGLYGGSRVRTGESVVEIVTAASSGYCFKAAIA